MGNAGRNGGEYYTPRPLIRAMIQVVKPKIGERIYDGACGRRVPVRSYRLSARTAACYRRRSSQTLQTRTFYGKERRASLTSSP